MSKPDPARAAMSYSRVEQRALKPVRRGLTWLLTPVIAALIWARVPPAAISLSQIPLGFGAAALVGIAPRAALGLFLSTLVADALDGAVARATGRASTFGALLDQLADHVREITVIGGLVAAGALRGEIGVAYALTYPLFNSVLYVADRAGAPAPLAIKTWLSFYPALAVYLWFGRNGLDAAAGVAAGLMVLVGAQALIGLRRRMDT